MELFVGSDSHLKELRSKFLLHLERLLFSQNRDSGQVLIQHCMSYYLLAVFPVNTLYSACMSLCTVMILLYELC